MEAEHFDLRWFFYDIRKHHNFNPIECEAERHHSGILPTTHALDGGGRAAGTAPRQFRSLKALRVQVPVRNPEHQTLNPEP